MTIFDTGYSAFQYEPVSPLARIWSIARMEFGKIFKSKKGLVLFILSVVYVMVLLVLTFFNLGPNSEQFSEIGKQLSPRLSPFTREFYLGYSTDVFGFICFVLLTTIIGVRAIAADKAVNALEIYWTRGISPWGYFLGKWIGSFLLLVVVYVAGPLVVWLYGLLSAPDVTFMQETVKFIPSVILALLIKCAVLSFLAVGFSGLSSSPNIAMFMWLIGILGSRALVTILKGFARRHRGDHPEIVQDGPDWYDALCPWDAMVRIEEHVAGITSVSDYNVWIAWASLGALSVVLLVLLRRSLRTTEVMA
jgi:ABC-type transport system involved in multi-copper enzyme maturation permease subunit